MLSDSFVKINLFEPSSTNSVGIVNFEPLVPIFDQSILDKFAPSFETLIL